MIKVVPMESVHLDAAYEIEAVSFSVPWSKKTFVDDVNRPYALYFAAVEGDTVVGYAGMWHIVGDGHITNIAVAPDKRGRGIGAQLLQALVSAAAELDMAGLTLEVRVNNYTAQGLYLKNGFTLQRIRKNYYSDTNEDALVLWKALND